MVRVLSHLYLKCVAALPCEVANTLHGVDVWVPPSKILRFTAGTMHIAFRNEFRLLTSRKQTELSQIPML